jgi:SpoVK/Ycf46/Vps4 family AAA+-type ATPase
MAPESKDTIKAIVKTYTDREDHRFRADFIHGKGEGQIILLHGPPGTGTS